MILIKRAYESPSQDDGYRILVDRLWPRGLTKEEAHADLWLRDIAPSTELRKWYGHDPKKWDEFSLRYREELSEKKMILHQIKFLEKEHGHITLLFAGRDTSHTHALVIKQILSDNG